MFSLLLSLAAILVALWAMRTVGKTKRNFKIAEAHYLRTIQMQREHIEVLQNELTKFRQG